MRIRIYYGLHVSYQMLNIDAWFADSLCDGFVRSMCSIGVHPNVITTMALGFSIAFFALHQNGMFFAAAACIVLRQAFDCLDGAVARRCDKQSAFGMHYDTVTDQIFFMFVWFVVARRLGVHDSRACWAIAAATSLVINGAGMAWTGASGASKAWCAVKTQGGVLQFMINNTMLLFPIITVAYLAAFVR